MYDEDELLPLSGLQHLVYCARRAALVHVEGEWADNRYTVEGVHLHERVDGAAPVCEWREGVRIVRRMPLRSLELGLSGTADLVEFHRDTPGDAERALPVEYKRGARKRERAFEIQLCAQALCLEEMLGRPAPTGALYYGESRRRLELPMDATLREETRDAARRLHEIVDRGVTPPFERGPKCERCSLAGPCGIRLARARRPADTYVERLFAPEPAE